MPTLATAATGALPASGAMPWSRTGDGPLERMSEVAARTERLSDAGVLTAEGLQRVECIAQRYRAAGEAWEKSSTSAERTAACCEAAIALLELAKIEGVVAAARRAQFDRLLDALRRPQVRPAPAASMKMRTARPRAARRVVTGTRSTSRTASVGADASPASPGSGSRGGPKAAAPEDDDPDPRYLRVGPGTWQPVACRCVARAADLEVA